MVNCLFRRGIVVDGMDGSGKTTVFIPMLRDYLEERGVSTQHFRAKDNYLVKLASEKETHSLKILFSITSLPYYAHQLSKSEADLTIMERWLPTMSYTDRICYNKALRKISSSLFPNPELTYVLVTEPEVAENRKKEQKGKIKRHERMGNQKRLRENYIKMAELYDWKVIDTTHKELTPNTTLQSYAPEAINPLKEFIEKTF